MTAVEEGCIVHDRKYLSKFHGAINQLRRTNQFNGFTLKRLPKRCCSCQVKTGESSFNVDHLRKLCQEIEASQKEPQMIPKLVKPINYIILEFPLTFDLIQRTYKMCRFVGRHGANLKLLERKLNVRINIINHKTRKGLRTIVNQVQVQNEHNHIDSLWVVITNENSNGNPNNMENVKQTLQDDWKKLDSTIKNRPAKIISSALAILSSADISGDARWK
ncbi:unnamed protein product [Rotaria sp. Silwood1]|nr:unnamed protein product [Rotaria sp. Silwood1]CAF4826240.1 unnamed protein product [Rotaria sp. Silwood1]